MSPRLAWGLGWLGLACGVAGCGHIELHEYALRDEGMYTSRGPAELYLNGERPAHTLYEIAVLQAIGLGSDANLESVMSALAARGGELGCDAVVRTTYDRSIDEVQARGVCVRYIEGPARTIVRTATTGRIVASKEAEGASSPPGDGDEDDEEKASSDAGAPIQSTPEWVPRW
jgi:hypothetical protein